MKYKETTREKANRKNGKLGINRREMLRHLGVSGSALIALGALFPKPGRAQSAPAADLYIEKFPTSPFILEPFQEALPVPSPYRPLTAAELSNRWSIMPQPGIQDSDGVAHQIWPASNAGGLFLPPPLIYDIRLQVSEHSFTSSKVMPIDELGDPITPPRGKPGAQSLPNSTIYGFNGVFPGPMIYGRYGQPSLVRFTNELDNDHGLNVGDFGDPERRFLTHLHNGHTAPESDGNPHHKPEAYRPGGWSDNLYLDYPAGGDFREIQSFLWFHDHTHGHTSSNVYKGMVGLYPIYDPANDPGDERRGYRLPGAPKYLNGQPADGIDYEKRIDYDIPLALYDCLFDDGLVPHKDAHGGQGESHPEWWGKLFFKHFPNHGFVGDVFTVNGTAYPVLEVKRRRYRLRFLDASISRGYEFKIMQGAIHASPDQKGQWNMMRIQDGLGNLSLAAQQCMVLTQIASEGGLLPIPIVRDSFEIWPAKRREVIVDFSKYMDGTPTTKGDVMYLVNVMQMADGRWKLGPGDQGYDPTYAVPLIKIIIGDDAPDNSIDPLDYVNKVDGKATLRTQLINGVRVPVLRMRPLPDVPRRFNGIPRRTFELQRNDLLFGGEIEWLINGHAFDPADPNGMFSQAVVQKGRPELWVLRNNSGGWTHPLHIHQEEHRVISRNGVAIPSGRHIDDNSKEDVVALDPGDEVVIYRNFRLFTGKYVAHCHNLAHEDHAMMFGWEIV